MCYRSGAGPKGCPVKSLTLQKFVDALQIMRDPQTSKNAKALSIKMQTENGTLAGVNSFYRNLPLHKMVCDVSVFDSQTSRVASVFCDNCGLKMCDVVDKIIHRQDGGRDQHVRRPHPTKLWGKNIKKQLKSQIINSKVHKNNVQVAFNNTTTAAAATATDHIDTVPSPVSSDHFANALKLSSKIPGSVGYSSRQTSGKDISSSLDSQSNNNNTTDTKQIINSSTPEKITHSTDATINTNKIGITPGNCCKSLFYH